MRIHSNRRGRCKATINPARINPRKKLAPGNGLTPAVAGTNPQTFTAPTGAFPNQLAAIAIQFMINGLTNLGVIKVD